METKTQALKEYAGQLKLSGNTGSGRRTDPNGIGRKMQLSGFFT